MYKLFDQYRAKGVGMGRDSPVMNKNRLEVFARTMKLGYSREYGYWLHTGGDTNTKHFYLRRDGYVYDTCGSEGFYLTMEQAEEALDRFVRKYTKLKTISYKRDGKLIKGLEAC